MKYFFGLIIILFAVAYQLSSNNEETLSEAKVENTYQSIDLKKITIKSRAPQEFAVGKNTITNDNTAETEAVSKYDAEKVEESEEQKEYIQSKYSLDADQIYKPEMSRSEMEIIKKHKMKQSRLQNSKSANE